MAKKMTSCGKIKTLKTDCEEDGGGDDEQQDENERSE
jgi:hypothetical protein